jgi:hypothetical protein
MDEDRIKERVNGRDQAILLLDLDAQERETRSKEWLISFWEHLQRTAKASLESLGVAEKSKPLTIQPMSDEHCRFFEKQPMPFGKYRDWKIDDVISREPAYLDWLVRATEEDTFKADLRRYLANPSIQELLP